MLMWSLVELTTDRQAGGRNVQLYSLNNEAYRKDPFCYAFHVDGRALHRRAQETARTVAPGTEVGRSSTEKGTSRSLAIFQK